MFEWFDEEHGIFNDTKYFINGTEVKQRQYLKRRKEIGKK
jgi:hypothetical protein